jgi:protein-arginine kinase activator protein McsA
MKKGLISVGILTGFLLSILMVSGVFAAKDVVTFDVPYGKVTFNHKQHAETLKIDCVKCHHTWKKGETTGKLCVDCHKAKAEGKTLSIRTAKAAMRKRRKPANPQVQQDALSVM